MKFAIDFPGTKMRDYLKQYEGAVGASASIVTIAQFFSPCKLYHKKPVKPELTQKLWFLCCYCTYTSSVSSFTRFWIFLEMRFFAGFLLGRFTGIEGNVFRLIIKQIVQQGNTKNVDPTPFVGGIGMYVQTWNIIF